MVRGHIFLQLVTTWNAKWHQWPHFRSGYRSWCLNIWGNWNHQVRWHIQEASQPIAWVAQLLLRCLLFDFSPRGAAWIALRIFCKSSSAETNPLRESRFLFVGLESTASFFIFFPENELKRASISSSCLLRFFFGWDGVDSATENKSPEDSFGVGDAEASTFASLSFFFSVCKFRHSSGLRCKR